MRALLLSVVLLDGLLLIKADQMLINTHVLCVCSIPDLGMDSLIKVLRFIRNIHLVPFCNLICVKIGQN